MDEYTEQVINNKIMYFRIYPNNNSLENVLDHIEKLT